MTRYLLDTDTFSLYLRHHSGVVAAMAAHSADERALTVITVGELWDGWHVAIRKAKTPEQAGHAYDRLSDTLNELRHWPVVSFSAPAIRRYADLKRQKLNVRANDLKIAAIALEMGATVITHNVADFRRLQGLAMDDWVP